MPTVTEFILTVKPYMDDYRDIHHHISFATWNEAWGNKWKVPQEYKARMIELNSAVELRVETDAADGYLLIHAPTALEAMALLRERYPEIFNQVPAFDCGKFEGIAALCKCSSTLTYIHVPVDIADRKIQWYLPDDLEADDYIGDYPDAEAFIKAADEKRMVAYIQCYPHTPIGFFSYYGFDINELMDRVIME